jgi:ERCC4-type nuclease
MPPVVIDTREQRPYAFPGAVPGTLPTGDYSLLGFEHQVAVERKSKSDAYSSLGRDRARFRREAERLGAMPFGAIVVEADTVDFLRPPPFSQLAPTAALHSLLSWSVRFRLPVFFAGDREHGAMITLQLLHKFWHHHGEGARG